jgi:hypothetical protein
VLGVSVSTTARGSVRAWTGRFTRVIVVSSLGKDTLTAVANMENKALLRHITGVGHDEEEVVITGQLKSCTITGGEGAVILQALQHRL